MHLRELPQRRKMSILGGVLLAMLLGALDATIVGPAMPRIVQELSGMAMLSVGLHDLLADLHHHDSDRGQALGPLRPQVVSTWAASRSSSSALRFRARRVSLGSSRSSTR